MNDAELTALAAKAFGNPTDGFSPLTDDGNALRLAVKLDIDVVKSNDLKHSKSKTKWCTVTAKTQDGFEVIEYEHPDPYAATRRAIVRAAAEIGKMKGEK